MKSSAIAPGFQRCPWCGGSTGRLLETVSYEGIFDALVATWHVRISAETRAAVQPSSATQLFQCDRCGLQVFIPVAPGTPAFYAELTSAMPYHRTRWEFDVVRDRITAANDVLDLGCGEGDFLRTLGARAGRTVGVDHNIPAVDRLQAAGVEAVDERIESFAERESSAFDVVTSFHLLEHVSDPRSVISAAARCLRPGGQVFLSVPNRDRAFKDALEPLDAPPHHVSRWGATQFRHLPDDVPLEPVGILFEPPHLSAVRASIRIRVEGYLRAAPSQDMRATLARAVAKVASGPVRHRRRIASGAYTRAGVFGHSMLIELRRTPLVSA